ncbi:putative get1 protein [Rutstroemia sp. NJR-2017a WRK4]|nr:putative get1 protein [Rutstroemia sp. NJR-2017a WRK4]
MPSILLTCFVVQLLIHIVNTFGAAAINNLIASMRAWLISVTQLWNLYNMLPTPTSQSAAEQKKLKREYMKVRQEMNATSSQDEFAKWAKLRRQHDKLYEQLEKSKTSLDSNKATFDTSISTLRWLGTNGLRMLLQFWFSKRAMFWLPKGWFPYYAEWLLSFPRAPMGSISIQAWTLACAAVILLVSDALVATVALVMGGVGVSQKEKKEPMKVPAGQENAGAKKEL